MALSPMKGARTSIPIICTLFIALRIRISLAKLRKKLRMKNEK
jgi:hypothetical protein